MLRIDQTKLIGLVAERLRVLGDENRIKLVLLLKDGERTVGALVEELGIGQASVSKHLGVLKGTGLVECRRAGNQAFYRVHDEKIFDMCALVCQGVIRHIQSQQSLLATVKSSGLKKGRAA